MQPPHCCYRVTMECHFRFLCDCVYWHQDNKPDTIKDFSSKMQRGKFFVIRFRNILYNKVSWTKCAWASPCEIWHQSAFDFQRRESGFELPKGLKHREKVKNPWCILHTWPFVTEQIKAWERGFLKVTQPISAQRAQERWCQFQLWNILETYFSFLNLNHSTFTTKA